MEEKHQLEEKTLLLRKEVAHLRTSLNGFGASLAAKDKEISSSSSYITFSFSST